MSETRERDLPIRVAAICGSLRPMSCTRMALQYALRGAAEAGAETRLIDLRDYGLVFCDGNETEGAYPPGVFELRRHAAEADGLLLGTPEYHGSFSGVLKNALDLLGFDEFQGKMIGLVGVSGGRMGALEALTSLRTVGRALHAWVIPEQAAIPEAERVFDESGKLSDPRLEKRLLDVGRQLARYARLHKCGQASDFLRLWEGAPVNPGGEHAEPPAAV